MLSVKLDNYFVRFAGSFGAADQLGDCASLEPTVLTEFVTSLLLAGASSVAPKAWTWRPRIEL